MNADRAPRKLFLATLAWGVVTLVLLWLFARGFSP